MVTVFTLTYQRTDAAMGTVPAAVRKDLAAAASRTTTDSSGAQSEPARVCPRPRAQSIEPVARRNQVRPAWSARECGLGPLGPAVFRPGTAGLSSARGCSPSRVRVALLLKPAPETALGRRRTHAEGRSQGIGLRHGAGP